MNTAFSDAPLDQDDLCGNGLGAHTTKTLHKVRAVSMPHEAAEPRNLSLALPPLSAPLAGVCSLEGTLLIGHFLLTGAVRRGETSVGVAVT